MLKALGRVPRNIQIIFLVVGIGLTTAAVLVPRFVGRGASTIAELKGADTATIAASSLRERFVVLSARHTNKCGLRPDSLESIATGSRLQGSC